MTVRITEQMSTTDYENADEEHECIACDGLGYFPDECTCGDDTCCCLEPENPDCPECDGSGYFR